MQPDQVSNDTPSIPRPAVMCLDCGQRTTNPGMRCDTHRRDHNKKHRTRTAYYHSTEWAGPNGLRAACLTRDYETCVACGNPGPRLTAHHIKPRADGGTDTLDNLVAVCQPCHSRIETGDQPTLDRLALHLEHSPHHATP